jgi:hypothetical protein
MPAQAVRRRGLLHAGTGGLAKERGFAAKAAGPRRCLTVPRAKAPARTKALVARREPLQRRFRQLIQKRLLML